MIPSFSSRLICDSGDVLIHWPALSQIKNKFGLSKEKLYSKGLSQGRKGTIEIGGGGTIAIERTW